MAEDRLEAAGGASGEQGDAGQKKRPVMPEVPKAKSSRLSWAAEGAELEYVATAGHIPVRDADGQPLGQMFSLSYVVPDDAPGSRPVRPVTFCYNGGPGSSSVPVNFGGMGPVRIRPRGTEPLGMLPGTEDNPHTLLRQSDLVFLDALGTGWSKVAEGLDTKRVWGVDADADAFARAIVAWLDANGRWDSPVYLFGESYGTVRNAVVMRLLTERGVDLAGVVMLSALFDYVQTLPTSDLYHIGMLPVYAATAQWFGRAGVRADADGWYDDACAFAEGPYAAALLRGDRLPAREERAVAKRYAQFTGLDAGFVTERGLRVELDDFRRELLRDEGRVTGRLDTRFAAAAPAALQRNTDFFAGEDAADAAVESAMTAAFKVFVGRKLGYRGPGEYKPESFAKVGGAWNWGHAAPGVEESPIANVGLDISTALYRNPRMRVAVLGGRYDAATPWWNVCHDVSCLRLRADLRERVEFHRYGCGHMAYIDEPSLAAIADDLATFYAAE